MFLVILPDAGAISTSAEFLLLLDSTISFLLKFEISNVFAFLAHLSRRLTGDLIG